MFHRIGRYRTFTELYEGDAGFAKEKRFQTAELAGKRLADAKECFLSMAKETYKFDCEILIDAESLNGKLLLFEIANIGLIGPSLGLAAAADPSDGFFNVVWVRYENRKEWISYLNRLRTDAKASAPVEQRRCQHITFRRSKAPLHVDGDVFPKVETPCCVTIYPDALKLIDLKVSTFDARQLPLKMHQLPDVPGSDLDGGAVGSKPATFFESINANCQPIFKRL